MNELDLIKEVEKRPILYDKSVSGFNKTKLRDDAWKEVQEALNVTESECKKRWRSLRDSFIKLQRTHGGRTRWPYHQAMRFLLPHIEPKAETGIKKEEDSDPEEEVARQRAIQNLPDFSFNHDKYEDDEFSEPSPKKQRLNSTDEESCQHCTRTDPDELFLLSCAPTLKRLNSKKNAVARLKIQQVLYEAAFGREMDASSAQDHIYDEQDD
ncbi:transcription factor Adf-1-like isoform X2 [Bombyx mandarina]|uniref:Transcription factor Adf-1 n=2 Tax=Bombyx TaxID=7090 RepID=A0A8R1WEH0_BOMMO|nr:transcription factor Adf-1 isoform X2 [Bombyx mori]XP_028027992.1 transcription factor Adf-1-like isoform X2 [Bombyx mandarina]